jgi:diguanylate cyclase (GGDEF)-like protein
MNQDKEKIIPMECKRKIEIALVLNLYKQAKIGLFGSLICGSAVLYYLYHFNPSKTLFAWFAFFLGVLGLRFILIKQFVKAKRPEDQFITWRNLFIVGAFLSGISWGLVGSSLLLPTDSGIVQALILVILASVCAGSVPVLAPSPTAAIVFLIPAMLPVIMGFLAKSDSIYTFFILTMVIFLIYLVLLSLRTFQIIKNSILVQVENDALILSLSKAKTQLEQSNIRLKQAATHDPLLTNVANRSLFEARLQEALDIAKKEHKILALLYLDLDNFKEVNDKHGHDAGDQLLLIVVERLKNILREGDIVSRLGGDELTVILENIEDVPVVAEITERICQVIAEPIKLNNAVVNVHASIGISIFPIDGEDMSTLTRVADRAMYYVKDHGGNNYHFNVQVEGR